VLCHSRQQVEQVQARLAGWLSARGLAFNEGKTSIVCLDDGFDFLGFNVRRYGGKHDGKLLIKPSKAAIRRIRERLRTEIRSLRGAPTVEVIARLNPIVRGWAAYYRHVVSSEIFTSLDHYLWKLVYKWARHRHRNKPTKWIVNRYFGMFNKARRNVWVFGDRDSGAYLHKFAWTNIVRHQMVTATASVDDPALTEYWTARRRRTTRLPVDRTSQRLLDAQHGRCPLCDGLLLHADHPPQTPHGWEMWIRATRKALERNAITLRDDGTPDEPRLRLIHTHCHRRNPDRRQTSTAERPPATGLA
jgi:RNA-directed DNA polymerase